MFDGLGVAWCAILWTNKRRRELKLKSELGRERKRKAKKKKDENGALEAGLRGKEVEMSRAVRTLFLLHMYREGTNVVWQL